MRIGALLVDDEPDVRLVLRMMIEAENDGLYVVGEAADGSEALEAVDQYNPTVIVLDERMPTMSGVETAAIIMARRPGQTIVLCSAFMDDALRERASKAGVTSCVTKGELSRIPRLLKELANRAA